MIGNIVKKTFGSLLCLAGLQGRAAQPAEKPNIIVILADDMGFSDLGCYGSEISTPNLDRLAQEGLRYTQFYNGARCCPSRAALLTGVYAHEAGMGWMTNSDLRTSAYRGDLRKNVRTIAEVLRPAGYATYISGKWHVSDLRKNQGDIEDNWPIQRGFDRFYGIVGGAADYFNPKAYRNNECVPESDHRFFTDAISEEAASFIQGHSAGRPFFLYLAYTAPHWPLHAREKTVEKYKGMYDGGWDRLRETRLKKQKKTGLLDNDIKLSPRDPDAPVWDSLSAEKKKDYARRMEIYAAQIDEMDQGIGQVLSALEKTGQMNNTLIFFLSDNGACAEFISSGKSKDLFGDLSQTWESYRLPWANASCTPFREFKHFIHEGGIRTPMIVHWPDGVDRKLDNGFVRQPGHLVDIMATCVDVAGATYPKEVDGRSILPMRGTSLNPSFSGGDNGRGPIFWEHEANIGMRDGDWKLVTTTPENTPFDENRLELYNIAEDPTELHDLSVQYPEKRRDMYARWTAWGKEVGAFPLDSRDWGQRNREMRRHFNCEFDYNFGGWRQGNPQDLVQFSIDRSGKLSGTNSACVTVMKTGSRPANALLAMDFPPKGKDPFHVSFQAAANRKTTLIIRVENHKKPAVKIVNKTVEIGPEPRTIELDTSPISVPGDYQLVFYFGTQPAGDQIWIDAIDLEWR